MSDNEITARDRIKAVSVAIELEDLAKRVTVCAWFLRPLAKLLRWMAAP